MAWFERDHTGRALSTAERAFLAALVKLLSPVKLPQVDENETAITAEGTDCLIVLIPHRNLGGVSLVVWLFPERAEVTWAQVAGLGCCHDSLDLGVPVASFGLSPERPDFGPVIDSIREQCNAPLTVKVYTPNRATVSVCDRKGVLCKVGELGPPLGWLERIRPGSPARESVIRLADSAPPPVSEPSRVDEWFTIDHSGA
jgi:hypothetical protein